jgi:hypothetical protein
MGRIIHYNNGKTTIYTAGESISGLTTNTDTYYIGVDNTSGIYEKLNPDGNIINLETSPQFQYEIGEYVPSEGGVIFHRYLTGTTQNYLVVDTQDLGQDVWSNIDNVIIGVSASSIWNGLGNTTAIITQLGAVSGAAFSCQSSNNQGFTDWYLPAIHELNKLWFNMLEVSKGLDIAGGSQLLNGALTPVNYWSSTELDANYARYFAFYIGDVAYDYKYTSNYIRAVRQFSI